MVRFEGTLEIRIEDGVPLLGTHAHEQAIARHPGVVHEDVDLIELGRDFGHRFLAGFVIGNIERKRLGDATGRRESLRAFL